MSGRQIWTPLELEAELVGGPEELVDRLKDLGGELDSLLVQEKALVFRGFAVAPGDLDDVLELLLPDRSTLVSGTSRRAGADDGCTACQHPQELTVPPHSELSHVHAWPSRLAFYYESQPDSVGATLVVDAELWLRSLDVDVREAFADGVRYIRNLHDGHSGTGRSWQDTFRTSRREDAEALLDGSGAAWHWRADGGLRIEFTRPATVRHPVTGAETWFNQTDLWHPAGFGDDTAAHTQRLPEREPLSSVTFADGSPIPAEYVRQIHARGLGNAVDVEWRVGDLLLIDNVLVAHGRRPFTGEGRVRMARSH